MLLESQSCINITFGRLMCFLCRALANVQATMGIDPTGPGADVEMEDNIEAQGLPSDVVAEIEELSKT